MRQQLKIKNRLKEEEEEGGGGDEGDTSVVTFSK